MKARVILILLAFVLLAPGLGRATTAAQTGGDYDLTWNTIAGGGGASAGGVYALDGTIGQPCASTLNGGSFSLAGGFWEGGQISQEVYLPLVIKR